ncbi:Vitamin B12 transporter BtuB [Dyadobacter sp. CECT 9623]|uniref:Vitamin B12 transporter BtuB n=1 Tax=Dyadobacter linearis TaxID=2823330 RepID=A0ABN7REU0_9BACT|nr:Plug domain-containing protein [Dyadobacter sp. CECT 9623]CAG5074652.1 Vitamin B12 transporter BtuB [Dyadobacter sp. CECT 9623]
MVSKYWIQPTLAGLFNLGKSGFRDYQARIVIVCSPTNASKNLTAPIFSNALNILPGVSIANVGQRNESVVYVRGFDLRQVPVFIDGVPVYVPYDGYVDMGRFTTFDLAEINVSKGFASILYGANTKKFVHDLRCLAL